MEYYHSWLCSGIQYCKLNTCNLTFLFEVDNNNIEDCSWMSIILAETRIKFLNICYHIRFLSKDNVWMNYFKKPNDTVLSCRKASLVLLLLENLVEDYSWMSIILAAIEFLNKT